MSRSLLALAAVMAGGALALTGCQSHSYSCSGNECHVTVTGAGQSVEVSEMDVTVSEISAGGATIEIDGSQPATIGVGESAQVGDVTVTVTSVKGDEVKFDMK